MFKRKQCRARPAGRSDPQLQIRSDDPCDCWDPFEVLVIAMAASRAWGVLKAKAEAAAATNRRSDTKPRTPGNRIPRLSRTKHALSPVEGSARSRLPQAAHLSGLVCSAAGWL